MSEAPIFHTLQFERMVIMCTGARKVTYDDDVVAIILPFRLAVEVLSVRSLGSEMSDQF